MAKNPCQPAEISVAPAFQRDIQKLSGAHPLVADLIVAALVEEIGPEPTCGWAIRTWGSRVRKLRVVDKCHNRGKSSGFRLIYDWEPDSKVLWLLRLYTHAQMEDIANAEIKKARAGAGID
ncbi:MAG: type II toxin-antitoxin system RelE family toxin [Candidatus Binataceae bacterium]